MHAFSTAQSRSAWTEQEDEMLRQAVAKYGDRAWATVANDVPGRSSKSCSDRWRNFLSPDIEHPRKSPFTEWEVAVVVQSQKRYGNNWKAISMLLPGRTNRAVKNLFVGNLKWGARLAEIKNIWLEKDFSLEQLLEIKPDHAGGPVNLKPGMVYPDSLGSPLSMKAAASTSSAGSAWASDVTDQPLTGSPASQGTHQHGRKRGDTVDPPNQSPASSKRRRGHASPLEQTHGHYMQHGQGYSPAPVHPGALGPGMANSPTLGLNMVGDMSGLMGPPGAYNTQAMYVTGAGTMFAAVKQRVSTNGTDSFLLPNLQVIDEGSPSFGAYGTMQMAQNHNMGMSGIPGLPMLATTQHQMQMQQQQQHGQQIMGQVGAWNHPGTLSDGGNSPFACVAGETFRHQQTTTAGCQSYVGHVGAIAHTKPEPMQGIEGGDCTGNMAAYMQQQQQQHQQQQSYWDPSGLQYTHAQHQHQQQQMQAQHQQHFGDLQCGQQAQQQPQQLHQHAGPVPQLGTTLGSGLAIPGSPSAGLGAVLQMPSQDLDQILGEGGLGLDAEGVDELLADPQLMAAAGMSGQVAAHLGQADGAAPASLADVAPPATAVPMARSNTWPLQDAAAAAGAVSGGGAVPPAAAGPASFSGVSSHVSGGGFGVSLPPRSVSATGAALNSQTGGHQSAGPDSQAGAGPVWNWSHGPHRMPGHAAPHSMPGSGPPSHGGMAPQGMGPERSSTPQYHQQQQQQLMLNMQLQQENLLLMRKVETLQSRLASAGELPPMKLEVTIPEPADAAAVVAPAPTPVGAAPMSCEPIPAGTAAVPTPAPATAGAAAAAFSSEDMPRLPPVATRVPSTTPTTAAAPAAIASTSVVSPTAQWDSLKLEDRHSGLSPLGCTGSGEDLALISLMGPQGGSNCLDGAVDW